MSVKIMSNYIFGQIIDYAERLQKMSLARPVRSLAVSVKHQRSSYVCSRLVFTY